MAYSVVVYDEASAFGGSSWAGVEVQESWLAKLGSWSKALSMYERKLEENPNDVSAILGCMRCLDARGEWRKVIELAENSWAAFSNESGSGDSQIDSTELRSGPAKRALNDRSIMSRNYRRAVKFCAQAAWRLGQWDDLETFSSQLVHGRLDSHAISSPLPKASNNI
eukprot:6578466-Ditylum_brightwellii.AAC.1